MRAAGVECTGHSAGEKGRLAGTLIPLNSVKRFLAPSDFTEADTWRLVEWCRSIGANEFTIDCLAADTQTEPAVWAAFARSLEPFRRYADTRERMSGPTADDLVRQTPLWELNRQTVGALKAALPRGLFGYDPAENGWFEDPIFYRGGHLILGVLSHEAFGVLRLSEAEAARLAAEGFKSHDALPRVG